MLLFSRWPGTATAHTHKFVSVRHKKNIWQTFIYPKHEFRPRRRLNWRQQLIPINSWVYSIKKKHLRDMCVSQTCVSSEKKVELTAIARTHKFVGVPHKKKTFERHACIPNMRFVREEAYSSSYWLIWRLRRPRFHQMPQISCTTWCQIQTFGFVNASILLIKIRDVKLRER